MINNQKISKAFKNPDLAIKYIYRKLIFFFSLNRYYSSLQSSRSLSDDGYYPGFARLASMSPRVFRTFRSNSGYERILGRDLYEDGVRFLDVIKAHYPDLLSENYIETFKMNDYLGGPRCFNYESLTISPATLRYIKTAGHIRELFGNKLDGARVAEIGGGFGGQAFIMDRLFSLSSYRIFDLYDVNFLINRYLENFLLNCCVDTSTINSSDPICKYDFIISNFAFSELPRLLQVKYLHKVIKSAPMGFMTMNSGFHDSPFNDGKMMFEELSQYLPASHVLVERPQESGRYIIVWGNN